jgi:Sigma-70, region 4
VAASGHNPEEQLARREMRKLMSDAIAQLPRDLRRACLLRDVLQYSTQEVADRLSISAMAVRLRLFRAHRQLREKLGETSRTRKDHQACVVAPERLPRRVAAPPKREPAIPFGAYAGFACGD